MGLFLVMTIVFATAIGGGAKRASLRDRRRATRRPRQRPREEDDWDGVEDDDW